VKRTIALATLAVLLILVVLAMTMRSSFASPDTAQDDPPPASDTSPAAVSAAAAPVFSYQGQLTNASGTPITNAALPMTFRLFPTLTNGTACWSENQNVNVQSGQFSVLLGQLVAIPGECVTTSPYLELVVNGETMTPREVLVSVAAAVRADSLSSNGQAAGPLAVLGELSVNNELIANPNLPDNTLFYITNNSGGLRLRSSRSVNLFIDTNNDSSADSFGVYRDGSDALAASAVRVFGVDEWGNVTTSGVVASAGLDVTGNALVRGNISATGDSVCNGNGTCLLGTDVKTGNEYALHVQPELDRLHLMPFANNLYDQVCIGCGVTGRGLIVRGGLEVHGGCTQVGNYEDGTFVDDADCEPGSITSGAYVEANLMTNEERAAETVDRFEQGDVLCWSADAQKLELCAAANDRLVMAVADQNGKPIVLGAEPVKVIGPVVAGDLLVSSGVPGHAMVDNDPQPGTVIGQALEDLDGESGIIKAMIRKW